MRGTGGGQKPQEVTRSCGQPGELQEPVLLLVGDLWGPALPWWEGGAASPGGFLELEAGPRRPGVVDLRPGVWLFPAPREPLEETSRSPVLAGFSPLLLAGFGLGPQG